MDAVDSIYGEVLILAGAGTGKTTTLIYRIANMIDIGVNPENILLLTFTNKAAEEMKNRIIRDIGTDGEKITACTFHSFCANFLRKNSSLIGISNNFTILDSTDSVEAIGMAMSEFLNDSKMKEFEKDFPTKTTIANILSRSVNSCEDIMDVIRYSIDMKTKSRDYTWDIKDIVERYIEYKKTRNLMDYDDLLSLTLEILNNYEDVRSKLDKQYQWICCDEYQDTNTLQDRILLKMSRDYPNLAVVGDDNQSIYKFRCAEIDNILSFHNRFPSCQKIYITENYRSSQEVLDFSNAIMEYASEGIEKKLTGQFHGEKPYLIVTENNKTEEREILSYIKKFHADGIKYKDMAVIIRSAFQSFGLEQMLNYYGIPYKKFGGMRFLEKEVVKDVLSFMKLTVNETDEIALYRVLKKYPGIGKSYAKKLSNVVYIKDIDALKDVYKTAKFHKYIIEFVDEINKLKTMNTIDQLKELLDNYYPVIIKRILSSVEFLEKTQKIKEAYSLIDMAKGYTSTKKFLEDLVLDATVPNENEDALNITTIHSAKGLEYEAVFIMDAIDGIFPRTKYMDNDDAEELRCLYVAATRAKKHLLLFAPYSYDSVVRYVSSPCPLAHFLCHDKVVNTMNFIGRKLELDDMIKTSRLMNNM